MEWNELQALWQQDDARITKNTCINNEALIRLLRVKPERKVNRETLKTLAGLFLSPAILLAVLTSISLEYNHGLSLYLGGFLFGCFYLWVYLWSLKYLMLLRKIDFTNSIIATRKRLKQLEKYLTKKLIISYLSMPIAIIGVFLIFKITLFEKTSVVPLFIIFGIIVSSILYKFVLKIRWFRKLNIELDEIEQLEKE